MSVTHTFIDSIPSIFLGAPDDAMALGVLPGHRYLLMGLGKLAVKLTLVGSYSAIIFSIILFPFMMQVEVIYEFLKNSIPYILLFVSLFLIITDSKKKVALITYLLAGSLGLVSLQHSNALFPLLSGLFGVSTMLYSLKQNEKPKAQKNSALELNEKLVIKTGFASSFAGGLTSLLPGVGSSTAALLAQYLTGKIGDKGFMILVGGANTANFVLSLATWLAISKARNGSIVAISQISNPNNLYVLKLLLVAVAAAGIAMLIAYLVLKKVDAIFKIPYRALSISVILLIITLTIILSGITGLIILLASTSTGLMPAAGKCKRSNAMACLILPVIVNTI